MSVEDLKSGMFLEGLEWVVNVYTFFSKALKTRLEEVGYLGKLKSQIRAEIFRVLESEGNDEKKQPKPSAESLLVHELLRDCLEWFGYSNTLSVFLQGLHHSKQLIILL